MMEYGLQLDDFKEIKVLMEITTSIVSLYSQMYELEIQGKKDTMQYQSLIEYLKIAIEVEEEKYKEANLTYEKRHAWLNYFKLDRLPEGTLFGIESIVKQDERFDAIQRIFNRLNLDDTLSIRMDMGASISNEWKAEFYRYICVKQAIQKDFWNSYLFLQHRDVICDRKGTQELKQVAIKSKYRIACINKNMEIDMLWNEFELPESLDLCSNYVAEMTQIIPEFYQYAKGNYGKGTVLQQMLELENMKDNDFTMHKIATLRTYVIRTAFLFMDENFLSTLNDRYHQLIEKDPNSANPIGKQFILDCFQSIKKDRQKIKHNYH